MLTGLIMPIIPGSITPIRDRQYVSRYPAAPDTAHEFHHGLFNNDLHIAGRYYRDGGLSAAEQPSPEAIEQAQATNINTIDFSGSLAPLQMDIYDPLGTIASTVSTIGSSVSDAGTFRNFEFVQGSNLGDAITVHNTTNLQYLLLGMGAYNEVTVYGSTGLTIGTQPGTNILYLMQNSDVSVATQVGASQIYVDSTS